MKLDDQAISRSAPVQVSILDPMALDRRPALTTTFPYDRPASAPAAIGCLHRKLPRTVSDRLRRIANASDARLEVLLTAVLITLLRRHIADDEVRIPFRLIDMESALPRASRVHCVLDVKAPLTFRSLVTQLY